MTFVRMQSPSPGLVTLTLDRPAKRNALSWPVVDELCERLRDLHYRDDVRVVVLTGAGTVFCAGADLGEQFGDGRTDNRRPDIGRADLWSLLETLPAVVIAAVNGPAVTGGFLLAYCCDLIVADENAFFQDTHAKFGLIPTGGEVQRLQARLGPSRAAELLLASKPLDARTAQDWGIVSQVCPAGTVLDTALAVAADIQRNDPHSVRSIKRMLNAGLRTRMAPGMIMDELENHGGAANLYRSPESRQRILDFLNRS